jgi:hypothetical protein
VVVAKDCALRDAEAVALVVVGVVPGPYRPLSPRCAARARTVCAGILPCAAREFAREDRLWLGVSLGGLTQIGLGVMLRALSGLCRLHRLAGLVRGGARAG